MKTIQRVFAATALILLVPAGVAAQRTQYFEVPRAISAERMRFPRFLTADDRLVIVYQEFVAEEGVGDEEGDDEGDAERGNVYVSLLRSDRGREWTELPRRIGPIPYGGSSPPFLYSTLVTGEGVY